MFCLGYIKILMRSNIKKNHFVIQNSKNPPTWCINFFGLLIFIDFNFYFYCIVSYIFNLNNSWLKKKVLFNTMHLIYFLVQISSTHAARMIKLLYKAPRLLKTGVGHQCSVSKFVAFILRFGFFIYVYIKFADC